MKVAGTEVYTPEMASDVLSMPYPGQRRISIPHLRRIERDMQEGKFPSGTDLVFSGGILADGYHRLTAIVNTGTNISFTIKTATRLEVRSLDKGRGRTTYDSFVFENPRLAGVLTRKQIEVCKLLLFSIGADSCDSNVRTAIDLLKPELSSILEKGPKPNKAGYSTAFRAGVVAALVSGADEEYVLRQYKYLLAGSTGLSEPVNALRNKIEEARRPKNSHSSITGMKTGSSDRLTLFRLTWKAFNARNLNMKRLQVSDNDSAMLKKILSARLGSLS